MGKYFVDIADNAKEDMRFWYKVGDESVIEKIKKLLIELSEHPKTGTGRPESTLTIDRNHQEVKDRNLKICGPSRNSPKNQKFYES